MHGGTRAYRSSTDDDALGRDAKLADEVVVGRILIVIGVLLGRLALARAVSLIIECENTESCAVQIFMPVATVSQVFSIAVADQQRVSRRWIWQIHRRNLIAIGAGEL